MKEWKLVEASSAKREKVADVWVVWDKFGPYY
jgi:hypothetical protein